MAEFVVRGAFDIPLVQKKSGMTAIDDNLLKELRSLDGSFDKFGCYVFSRKSGRGSTPIYVGKAEKQKIFDEAFNPRNINNVLGWLNDQSHRKLQIWTITQAQGRGRPHRAAIDEIETVIIHWAKIENPALLNRQKRSDPNWSIRGVERAGRGKRPVEAIEFRRMIGLD